MEAPNVLAEESLYRFLEKHSDNRVKRELLLFWGMHPNARFDRKAICYALDCSKLDTEGALRAMVEEGLLDKCISNDVTLYSLTKNEERRRPVLKLAAFGRDQWQLMLKRMDQRDMVTKCQDRAEGS